MVASKVLVISGDGINCERETAHAFQMHGADVDTYTVNELMTNKEKLRNYQIFAFPGGFSFGDELGSGKIFSLKLKYQLQELLDLIVEKDKLAIGICNGFQMLTKLGLLPFADLNCEMSLAHNQDSEGNAKPFQNKWVSLEVNDSNCLWTKDIKGEVALPIRHGEGRVVLKQSHQEQLFKKLKTNKQVVFSYQENVNNSYMNIAGICDPSGRIFGLMPHPEAAIYKRLRPGHQGDELDTSAQIFKNAVNYFH